MRAVELITRWMGMSIKPSYNTPVQTSNGFIIGHEAPNASNVVEYLGIPYAQPPIGDLRFAAPVALEGDPKSTFKASEFVSTSGIDRLFIRYGIADILGYSQRMYILRKSQRRGH